MGEGLSAAVELVDSHAHLEARQFAADREEAIARAVAAGVTRIINAGASLPASEASIALAEAHETIYPAVGIHPHDAKTLTETTWVALQALARRPDVVAVGEIGLDFYYNLSAREQQVDAFRRQLALARALDKPVIIHDRDAHQDILRILQAEGGPYRGVFHCFAGDEALAEQAMELGFHLSFTGSITYKNSEKSHRVIRAMPMSRLLLETDAPFLTPEPYRGRRNEPAYVYFVAEKIAALRSVSMEEIHRVTSTNAYRLFKFENFGVTPKIAYRWKNALYLNLTSRCTNDCVFCSKQPDFRLGEHYLYLEPEREPSVAEVLAEVEEPAAHAEIVFCGYGEPTLRRRDLLAIAKTLKQRGAKRLRLNTNGQADLINKRPVAAEMQGLIDAVSISLNATDDAGYHRLCRPDFGAGTFDAVTDFIGQAKRYVPEVTVSVVASTGIDVVAARRLAEGMGLPLLIR